MKKTPKDSNAPARAIQRRKIDALTIDAMAKYVAVGHTEREAALLCEIKPSTWYEFKSRNLARATKWTEKMEAYKAKLINHNLERVQKSADGVGTKFPDFRAALALLKIQDPQRFGDTPTNQTNMQVNVMMPDLDAIYAQARRIAGLPPEPPPLPEPKPVKQLPAVTTPENEN